MSPEVRSKRPRCPFCHEPVEADDVKAGCSACMAWHHADCLAESGRCAACSQASTEPLPKAGRRPRRDVSFRHFASNWESWESLCRAAAAFATRRGELLVGFSHSHRSAEGVVTVWYRPGPRDDADRRRGQVVTHRRFSSGWDSWDVLFSQASGFAAIQDPDDLIGISHSAESVSGLVVVWYWAPAQSTEGRT